MRRLLRHRMVKFLAVGVLNTAFGYGVFALLLWLGLHYSAAALFATVLGVLFNFKTTGVLVFGSRDNRKIGRFVAVYGVVYGANVAGLWLLTQAGLNAYVGGLVLILPLALLAYFLQSKYVFAHETHQHRHAGL